MSNTLTQFSQLTIEPFYARKGLINHNKIMSKEEIFDKIDSIAWDLNTSLLDGLKENIEAYGDEMFVDGEAHKYEQIEKLLKEREVRDSEGFDSFKELKKNALEIQHLKGTLRILTSS